MIILILYFLFIYQTLINFFFSVNSWDVFLLIPDLSWVCCSMTPSQIVDRIASVSVLLTPRRTQDELNRHTLIAETVGLNMGQTQPGATPDAHTDTHARMHTQTHTVIVFLTVWVSLTPRKQTDVNRCTNKPMQTHTHSFCGNLWGKQWCHWSVLAQMTHMQLGSVILGSL